MSSVSDSDPTARTAPPPAVEFRGVSFRFGETDILRDVTFSVGPRELLCIVGPNGGGKTTLLKLILGILKPASGSVEIFGQPPRRTRLRIGYMPQHLQFDARFPISVLHIVLMGRLDRLRFGIYGKRDREAAMSALAEVELAGLEQRPFASLSGGQRQRVLIARALACEPDLLLLDEPTANVDQLIESRFFSALERLRTRMAVIMVNHDLGVVTEMAERVLCVNREAHTHPTSSLTGRSLEELYGRTDIKAVHHRHGDCHEHHQP